jgi:hypothetical protein
MAAAALATNTAVAQTRLNVPFNFSVDGKNCPAGVYSIDQGSVGNMVTLKSLDGSRNFRWLLNPGSPAPNDARVVLTFDGQGDTHTLRSVQIKALITARLDKKTAETDDAATQISGGQ